MIYDSLEKNARKRSFKRALEGKKYYDDLNLHDFFINKNFFHAFLQNSLKVEVIDHMIMKLTSFADCSCLTLLPEMNESRAERTSRFRF